MKEDEVEDKVEESKFEEEEPIRKKGKVIISRPTKSSTAIFTGRASRSKKKLKLGEEDAEEENFRKPPPTFKNKLNDIDRGARMENFKSLKYETRNADEKNQVEDMMMKKLGK